MWIFVLLYLKRCMFSLRVCKHIVAKVTLVPRKRDKVGHGEVTINIARIIYYYRFFFVKLFYLYIIQLYVFVYMLNL